jgi:hypothetical protein
MYPERTQNNDGYNEQDHIADKKEKLEYTMEKATHNA